MSQIQMLNGGGTAAPDLEFLSGDVGGLIGTDGTFNINIFTGDGLLTTGVPGTHTITITAADDLGAIEALGGTGVASRSGANTWILSSIVQNAIIYGAASNGLGNIGPLQDGQVVIGQTGLAPTFGWLTEGAGIDITNAAGSITIATTKGGLNWIDATNATYTLAIQTGYVTDRLAGVTYTLPAAAGLGDCIKIVGRDGLATVAQNAGQRIFFGNQFTAIGVAGSIVATNAGDCVTLRCILTGPNTEWRVEESMGNWTIN